ncbi:MAG TPA: PRC-barrel domain containing protein, partial [Pilimelia sp.]|nr:PRC-barrel domain containing protein [Pilimelia sp.]
MTDTFSPWSYRHDSNYRDGADLTGYEVEATDGGIGKVDEASTEVGSAHLVVDTGPWIFGKKVLLPAGVVNHVDHEDKKIYVDRT